MVDGNEAKICIPGERLLKLTEELKSGGGTCVRHGYICSTLAGFLHLVSAEGSTQKTVEVRRHHLGHHSVPFPNAIVTAKVVQLTPKFARCDIICVEKSVLAGRFNAQIRKEDVREINRDRAEILTSFKPGDIVLARCLTLGDAQSFLLSTAEPQLGVVSAACGKCGKNMVVVSLETLECPSCESRELRKVAKLSQLTREKMSSC